MRQIQFINIEESPEKILQLHKGNFVKFRGVHFLVKSGGRNRILFSECDEFEGFVVVAPKQAEIYNPTSCNYQWRYIRNTDTGTAVGTPKDFYNWITQNLVKVW